MLLNRTLGAGAVLIGAFLVLYFIPAQTDNVDYGALSPRDFPYFASLVVIVFGLVQILHPTGSNKYEITEMVRAGMIIDMALLTLVVMTYAGFLIAAPLLMLVTMLFAGERRVLWLGVGAILLPAMIWALFVMVLGQPLS